MKELIELFHLSSEFGGCCKGVDLGTLARTAALAELLVYSPGMTTSQWRAATRSSLLRPITASVSRGRRLHGEDVLEEFDDNEPDLWRKKIPIDVGCDIEDFLDAAYSNAGAEADNVVSIAVCPRGKDLHGEQSPG